MPRLSPSSARSISNHQLQHRLNLYALAAGAAGVSMIALATPSEAEVIYTPAHATLGCKGTYGIV
jgi:nicotinic acid phosphoribosyltransferase